MPGGSARCEICGTELTARASTSRGSATGRPSRYCSSACRQRAYRLRTTSGDTATAADAQDPAPIPAATPRAAAPTNPPAGTPGNLPVPLDGFVGRESELAELDLLLRRSRLLTLLGPGGAGKTRLALELGGRLRDSYPSGVWLVELGPLQGDELVAQTVAATLGVREQSGTGIVETMVSALAGRRMLMILDNCEHAAEPSARLAEELLHRCPDLRVVATSREVLRVAGEVTFRVGEMSLPPQGGTATRAELLQSDAVRLFVERARASVPDFGLTPENGPAIAAICARLDGIPLAIELAARRVRLLPVAQILARLDDRFGFLTTGSRTAAGRHRDLRAAIDWSYELLDRDEQAVLRRLSVLVGGFDLDAATAVCAGDRLPAGAVLDLVSSLEAKSLVVPEPGSRDLGRFRQLESIRLYGRERLAEAGELAEAHERLVTWLATLAEPFAEQSLVPDPAILERLDLEQDNLRQAVDWAAAHGDDRHALLAAALAGCWRERGHLAEGRRLLAAALAAGSEHSPHRGTALVQAAWLAAWQGDYDEALRLGSEALPIERELHRPVRTAKALQVLSFVQSSRGELDAAQAQAAECLELVGPLGRPLDVASCQHYLVCIAAAQGDLQTAEDLLAKCLPVYREHARPSKLGSLLHSGGEVSLLLGDVAAADARFRECLQVSEVWPDSAFWYGLEGMAIVAMERGYPERAIRLAAAAASFRPAGMEPEPRWRGLLENDLAAARDRLPERAAQTAHAAGRRLTPEQALAYALDDVWPGERGAAPGSSPLTKRELDVVRLVAQGLTNRQIAGRLRVSERTVESHLEHVRAKLDLRSRAQIAAWAAEQGAPAYG